MNNKYEQVKEIIFARKTLLEFTSEDEKLITKLWDAYWKKKKGDLRSDPSALACAILWRYSSDNGLWEANNNWKQQMLAELCDVRAKTASANASEIKKVLNIHVWDTRFCRKDIAEANPMNDMVMLENGFITSRDHAAQEGIPFAPLKKTKEDFLHWYNDMRPHRSLNFEALETPTQAFIRKMKTEVL